VPKPKWTAMDVIHFNDDIEALECAQVVLQTRPYAMESTDKMVLNLARGNIEQSRKLGFVQGTPDSLLMVEYAGESEDEVKEQVYKLEEVRKRERIGYASTLAFKPEEVKAIWGVRKAGLGLLLGIKGDKKPIAFVEDTAVEPAKLPEFIRRFREVVSRHDTIAGYYGHCSVGCMHIRPLINLKEESEKAKMVSIANAISDLVLEFNGAMSGEHGDGLARRPTGDHRDRAHRLGKLEQRARGRGVQAGRLGVVAIEDQVGVEVPVARVPVGRHGEPARRADLVRPRDGLGDGGARHHDVLADLVAVRLAERVRQLAARRPERGSPRWYLASHPAPPAQSR